MAGGQDRGPVRPPTRLRDRSGRVRAGFAGRGLGSGPRRAGHGPRRPRRGGRGHSPLLALADHHGLSRGSPARPGLGLYAATASVGFVAGQVLGGMLVEFSSWRAVFMVNVPIALVVALFAPMVIPADGRTDQWCPPGPGRCRVGDRGNGRSRPRRLRGCRAGLGLPRRGPVPHRRCSVRRRVRHRGAASSPTPAPARPAAGGLAAIGKRAHLSDRRLERRGDAGAVALPPAVAPRLTPGHRHGHRPPGCRRVRGRDVRRPSGRSLRSPAAPGAHRCRGHGGVPDPDLPAGPGLLQPGTGCGHPRRVRHAGSVFGATVLAVAGVADRDEPWSVA